MNRLIIIGNGFDLAHGMPTRYSDFVKWYLTTLFTNLVKGEVNDEGIYAFQNPHSRSSPNQGAESLIRVLDKTPMNENQMKGLFTILNNQFVEFPSSNTEPFFIEFKLPFLKEICFLYVEKNWVDIENLFYKKLLALSSIDEKNENRNIAVDLLNKGMDYLKDKLEEYLATLPITSMNFDILEIFKEDFNPTPTMTRKPDSALILNFNYTNTMHNYLQNLSGYSFRNIFIHGEIKNKYNPLIFGFGDEMDDHYKVLEKTNYNGFLDNMKSFGYFKTKNYQEITGFINSDEPFEVFIMGHSCGLSDRVMLNMIFEHHNCRSIKIFYYGDGKNNNYKTLTQEISRHFNKKNEMRLKIVPFEDSIPLPQLK